MGGAMIPAGALTHVLTLERSLETVAASGGVVKAWKRKAVLRAQLVQRDTAEFLAGPGEAEATRLVFRVRWREGITTADRIVYDGRAYDLREVVELGRRDGLELRVVAT